MSALRRILLVDDEPLIRVALTDTLSAAGLSVKAVSTGKEALTHIEQTEFEVAVLDLKLPDMSGIDLLRRLLELGSSTDVVMITAHGTVPSAVEAMKLGARDFLTKPFEAAALLEVVRRYLRVRDARNDRLAAPGSEPSFHGMVGTCDAMREMFRIILAASDGDAPILLSGETGTGKELAARALHACSSRRDARLVVLRCALVGDGYDLDLRPEARDGGPLGEARGGTLLLDEVADLPPAGQARLLQMLQDSHGREQGAPLVRVVASTRLDLRSLAAQGSFREDLFYRLNVLPVTVPPLRERGEDVQRLADHFLRQLNPSGQRSARCFSASTRNALLRYAWPGNVRELQNAVSRAVTLCADECIETEHLGLGPRSSAVSLSSSIQAEEDRRIDEALAQTGGRKADAAELLGISRKTLWEKLKRRGKS